MPEGEHAAAPRPDRDGRAIHGHGERWRSHHRQVVRDPLGGPGHARNGPTSDTIYLTTADRWGNMVSLIQSNDRGMGSGMSPGELGSAMR
jgi:gamma-glutamyltranspeptidase